MILILTGPTRSGKPTALFQWTKDRSDCGGFLSPDHKGLRTIYNVRDSLSIPFEKTEHTASSDIVIGRFIFEAESFIIASQWLDEHLTDPNIHYILMDEIGPLELVGQGWYQCLCNTLDQLENKTLILVVRRSLIDAVIQHYDLQDVIVVEKDYFLTSGIGPLLDDNTDKGLQ